LNPNDAARKIRRLAEITAVLRDGTEKHFEVTRLTSLKSLCQERDVAMRFGLHLAEHAQEQMQDKPPYSSLNDVEWEQYRQLAAKAVAAMRVYLTSPTKTRYEALYKRLSQVREAQDETTRPMGKCTVRIIHSTHLLVIEHALECFTSPEPGHWAYQAARRYAERFDSRYGTGLSPASAPLLEDILHFWTR
jgi:hypothetical protein